MIIPTLTRSYFLTVLFPLWSFFSNNHSSLTYSLKSLSPTGITRKQILRTNKKKIAVKRKAIFPIKSLNNSYIVTENVLTHILSKYNFSHSSYHEMLMVFKATLLRIDKYVTSWRRKIYEKYCQNNNLKIGINKKPWFTLLSAYRSSPKFTGLKIIIIYLFKCKYVCPIYTALCIFIIHK